MVEEVKHRTMHSQQLVNLEESAGQEMPITKLYSGQIGSISSEVSMVTIRSTDLKELMKSPEAMGRTGFLVDQVMI